MSKSILASVSLVVLLSGATAVGAENRMIVGDQSGQALVAAGASDTLSAPGVFLRQVAEDGRGLGPFGLVTGAVRGGVRASGQVLLGGSRMAVGILDSLMAPFRTEPQ